MLVFTAVGATLAGRARNLLNLVAPLRPNILLLILAVGGGRILRGVRIRIPVLCLPICAHEPSRFLKVGCIIQMFFPALDLGLHAATGLGPLACVSCHLLIQALILQLLVLMVPPELLQLLLFDVIGRIIRKVR